MATTYGILSKITAAGASNSFLEDLCINSNKVTAINLDGEMDIFDTTPLGITGGTICETNVDGLSFTRVRLSGTVGTSAEIANYAKFSWANLKASGGTTIDTYARAWNMTIRSDVLEATHMSTSGVFDRSHAPGMIHWEGNVESDFDSTLDYYAITNGSGAARGTATFYVHGTGNYLSGTVSSPSSSHNFDMNKRIANYRFKGSGPLATTMAGTYLWDGDTTPPPYTITTPVPGTFTIQVYTTKFISFTAHWTQITIAAVVDQPLTWTADLISSGARTVS